MNPTIGRIVDYTNPGDRDGKYPPEVQAAIITGINSDGTVVLHVFHKSGQFDLPGVEQAEVPAGEDRARGKWAWPAGETSSCAENRSAKNVDRSGG